MSTDAQGILRDINNGGTREALLKRKLLGAAISLKKYGSGVKKHCVDLKSSQTAGHVQSTCAHLLKGRLELTNGTNQSYVVQITCAFNQKLLSLIKSFGSASYDARKRVWSIQLKDHNDFICKVKTNLKDVVDIEPLPKWVVEAFGPPTCQNMKSVNELKIAESWNRLELEQSLIYSSLMPFQKRCVEFGVCRNGRIYLADDMGLGKTIQSLALACVYRDAWPLLIVSPSSMRFVWAESCQKWINNSDKLNIKVITSGRDVIQSKESSENSDQDQIVIISYDMVTRKESELLKMKLKICILDEAHLLKTSKSQRYQSISKVLSSTCQHIFLLSGTPALSRPIELYSQLALILNVSSSLGINISPYLPSNHRMIGVTDFGLRYCAGKKMNFGREKGSAWDFSGSSHMNELKLWMEHTCLIRRLKSEVLTELPGKHRQMVVLDSNLTTKTIESHPSTFIENMNAKAEQFRDKTVKQSEQRSVLLEWYNLTCGVKVEAVLSYLTQDLLQCGPEKEKKLNMVSGRKFICFAHHKVMLNAISARLTELGILHIRIDGSTSSSARSEECNKFQLNDEIRVAVLSITAANSGLTLTSAKMVVFAELFWNPGILSQAEDRVHRIGQTDNIIVQYLVAKGTADDEMWPLLQKKLVTLNAAGLSKDNFQSESMSTVFHVHDVQKEEIENESSDVYETNHALFCDIDDFMDDDDFNTL